MFLERNWLKTHGFWDFQAFEVCRGTFMSSKARNIQLLWIWSFALEFQCLSWEYCLVKLQLRPLQCSLSTFTSLKNFWHGKISLGWNASHFLHWIVWGFLFTKCFKISWFELSVAGELQALFIPEDHFRCFACAQIIQWLGKQNLGMEIICSK